MATRIHDLDARMLAALPSLPRPVLSRLVTRMIDFLDQLDGDPDLEAEQDQDQAHDDGCGPVISHGRVVWGSTADAPGETRPVYGEDQTLGPINSAVASLDHHRRSLGLVRNARGGWSMPS